MKEAGLEQLRQVGVEQGGDDLLEALAPGRRRGVDRVHLASVHPVKSAGRSTTTYFEVIFSKFFFFLGAERQQSEAEGGGGGKGEQVRKAIVG